MSSNTDEVYKKLFFTKSKEKNKFSCNKCNKSLTVAGSGFQNFKAHIVDSNPTAHSGCDKVVENYRKSQVCKGGQKLLDDMYATGPEKIKIFRLIK